MLASSALLEETRQHASAPAAGHSTATRLAQRGPIERAWRDLHSAEILLAEVVALEELSSQRPAVRSLAKRVLPANDARSIAIEQRLTNSVWDDVDAGEDHAVGRTSSAP